MPFIATVFASSTFTKYYSSYSHMPFDPPTLDYTLRADLAGNSINLSTRNLCYIDHFLVDLILHSLSQIGFVVLARPNSATRW